MNASLVDRHSVERLLLLVGALRSGLIDALADGEDLSAEQVAHAAETDPRATRVVLEALAGEEVVEKVSGSEDQALYRLSQLGRAHLVDKGPEFERFGLLHQASKMRGWLELPEVIRTGKPPVREPGTRNLRTMVSAMGERDSAILDEIVERCLAYAGQVRTMVDVGGAVGHLARHFSRRGVRATLFDREEVLPFAREFLGAEADRIELIGGDFTLSLPPGPFDLVYFGNVLHIYNPETNARVVRDAYSITAPGGAIAIQDYFLGRSPGAALFAVNMLRATEDGGVWTEADHEAWLTAAGFERVETFDLDTNRAQLILARRPAGLRRPAAGQLRESQ